MSDAHPMTDRDRMLTAVSVVGTTAMGKSALALQLAKQVVDQKLVNRVDIISADSRQVYRELEIISGADVPAEAKKIESENYYQIGERPIYLHGMGIIEPTEEWSLAHFRELVKGVMSMDVAGRRLVILVGGTGLYHKQAFNTEIDSQPPPSEAIRKQAEQMPVAELQEWLARVDRQSLDNLNQSDRQNPRRLIRSLEKSLIPASMLSGSTHVVSTIGARASDSEFEGSGDASEEVLAVRSGLQHTYLGLAIDKELLLARIEQRVKERLSAGALEEAVALRSRVSGKEMLKLPAFTSCGLKELWQLADGELSQAECISLWTQREFSYAKRQLTWWKRQKNITWFEATSPTLFADTAQLVEQLLARGL